MESDEKERKMPRTYKNVGAAVADPTSNIARFLRDARKTRSKNDRVIEQWMATGLTREQAWAEALKTCR